MDVYEKIVCDLFKVKGSEFIAKPRLVRSLAILNIEYENVYVDLFRENPKHKRFEKFTVADIDAMQARVERKKSAEVQKVLANEPT